MCHCKIMVVKKCFIPNCPNTSDNSNKIFASVPLDKVRRRAWYDAISYSYESSQYRTFCCEDHFDLEKDASNWIYYKLMGQKTRPNLPLKKHVVPHKNLNLPKVDLSLSSQLTSDRKQRIQTQANLTDNKKSCFYLVPCINSRDSSEANTNIAPIEQSIYNVATLNPETRETSFEPTNTYLPDKIEDAKPLQRNSEDLQEIPELVYFNQSQNNMLDTTSITSTIKQEQILQDEKIMEIDPHAEMRNMKHCIESITRSINNLEQISENIDITEMSKEMKIEPADYNIFDNGQIDPNSEMIMETVGQENITEHEQNMKIKPNLMLLKNEQISNTNSSADIEVSIDCETSNMNEIEQENISQDELEELLENEQISEINSNVAIKDEITIEEMQYEIENHKCNKCQYSTTLYCDFQVHIDKCNDKEEAQVAEILKEHKCPICDKCFPGAERLRKHMNFHKGKGSYVCKFCKKKFKTYGSHKSHLRFHIKPSKCEVCHKSLASNFALKTHMQTHSKPKFECSLCRKTFNSSYFFEKHMKHHIKLRAFKCEICDQTFVSASGLQSHMLVHMKKSFECKICGKTFTHLRGLTSHSIMHKPAQYHCALCSKSLIRKSDLERHMMMHSGERPFKCDACDKSFIANSALKNHRRHHTGEKAFACKICHENYTDLSTVKMHLMRKHVELFTCLDCNETFCDGEIVYRHMKMHIGERMNKCEVCNKTFRFMDSLESHKQIHLKEATLIQFGESA